MSPNPRRSRRRTNGYLYCAISDAHLGALDEALSQGADPRAPFEINDDPRQTLTPLMLAAEVRFPQGVARLLPLSEPLALDPCGRSALSYAAASGCLASLSLLLPHSDPLQTDEHLISPLMKAIAQGSLPCALALLPHSDLSHRDLLGRTALHIAQLSPPGALSMEREIQAFIDAQEMGRTLPGAPKPSVAKPRL